MTVRWPMLTFRTTGRTHGLLSSSRYAPTPRLTFLGKVSALYEAVSLKMLLQTSSQRTRSKYICMQITPVWGSKWDILPKLCQALAGDGVARATLLPADISDLGRWFNKCLILSSMNSLVNISKSDV
jgi:hypothetical protein